MSARTPFVWPESLESLSWEELQHLWLDVYRMFLLVNAEDSRRREAMDHDVNALLGRFKKHGGAA
ncbi:hypothetical protein [Burkholderia gladioli]|uniref:hypothetical protein n=1 Tax=Burkholderia gladioli TaxID=28095 RepID=UPI0015E62D5D|nr:hypothetical protein [Burkholderia gladioli]MBA1366238.1 hypothetical protein [Burkholderia gladioli]